MPSRPAAGTREPVRTETLSSPGGAAPRRTAEHTLSTFRYLFSLEVHVYASSIAANTLLSFFPFTLLILTVCRRWLHWEGAYQAMLQLLRANLPVGADLVIRNLVVLSQGHRRLQVMSVAMLLFTASGIFLPLETALNKVWGIERNRSYLRNQVISFALALASGVLALACVCAIASSGWLARLPGAWIAPGKLAALISRLLLEVVLLPCMVGICFAIYYVLPNGRVPARPVISAALVVSLLMEGGKFVYLATLPLFNFREVYGPFALSVTLLFWAFLGALVLLSGAHISARIHSPDGSVGRPAPMKRAATGFGAPKPTP